MPCSALQELPGDLGKSGMYAKVGSTILSASAVGTGFLRQEPRGIRSETRCQGQATGAVNILLKTPTCSTSVPVLRLLPANNQPSRQAFKFLSRCHLMGDGTEFGSLSLARSHHSYLWACKKENQRVRDLSVLEFSL